MEMNMELFIGTKALLARPMIREAYCAYRGWTLPDDENGSDEGYLVEYSDGGEPNHPMHKRYISWSPKAVFEAAYAPSGRMGFDHALHALKEGKCVARSGWNGKGMFIYRVGEGRYAPTTPTGHSIAAGQDDGLVPYTPYLAIKSVDGRVAPWLASQTDMLADDWHIVEVI